MRAIEIVAVATVFLGAACRGQSPVVGEVAQYMGSTDVGEPCLGADEVEPHFPGYSVEEVTVESSQSCGSGVCLVNHMQGRASCPYGQTAEEAQLDPACFVPGTEQPVLVEVLPQKTNRRGQDVSTCSCRCAGPGPGPFCVCPNGMECANLIASNGVLGGDMAGSYCIRPGTAYDPNAIASTCQDSLRNCGDPTRR